MTPAERRLVGDGLPADLGLVPSEGTPRTHTIRGVRNTLEAFYARRDGSPFIANDLVIYYPGEPAFVPDIVAVENVGDDDRMRWLVCEEARGIDLALDVVVTAQRRMGCERNVERYARLGIREYFVFDYSRLKLLGYRSGEPMCPEAGRLRSEVLGLSLQLQGTRLRFFDGAVMLVEPCERIAALEAKLAARLAELGRLRGGV